MEKKISTDKKIGYTMYHHAIGMWDSQYADIHGEEKSFMNYWRIGTVEEAKKVKAKNGMCWLYAIIPFKYPGTDSLEFSDGFEEELKKTLQGYKDAGVWDAIAGFETEEITCNITQKQFIFYSKYLRDLCPEKRLLACTSPYEIKGHVWESGFEVKPMNKETFAYVTDIGFDMYWTIDYAEHEEMLNDMKQKLGRDDVRIWFFPCTYHYNHKPEVDEDYLIKSLDIAYDLLKKEKYPGGICMYTWRTWGIDTALDKLLDPAQEWNYNRLAKRIVEIGKEILASDYVYDKALD